jgi:hypothetical protein
VSGNLWYHRNMETPRFETLIGNMNIYK